MIEGPWNNDACKGYAIMAMERAGLDPETIRKVSGAMTDCFDDTTVAEAGRYYVKGAVDERRDYTDRPNGTASPRSAHHLNATYLASTV